MASSFKIPKPALEGFIDLIEAGPERMDRLSKEIGSLGLTLDLTGLTTKLASVIDFPAERLERAIYSVLVPLNALRADFEQSAGEFLRMIDEALASQDKDWFSQAPW